ncbi:MAG: HAD family hydrolase [Acutalibacter sp.]|jgi:HAD superfamily hydrolase (TIGR01509 family)
MIRGAIFDLDGTLLDSMSLWDTIGEDYLRSLGKEHHEDLKKTFQTFTLDQSARYYQDHYGVTLTVEQIVAGIQGMIESYYRDTVALKPGVEEFLQELSCRGVRMCVATVTSQHLAEAALKRLGVGEYFSGIFTCRPGHGKEEPAIYREALEHLGTEKGETLVLEDAFHALRTAKLDGFPTVGVYDAHEERQTELKEWADSYIADYRNAQEFWRYLEGK